MTNINHDMAQVHARQLLGAYALFKDFEPAVLDALLQLSRVVRASTGDILFREGAPASSYLLVMQGKVEILRFGANGDEKIFGLLGEGQVAADAAMFMPHGRYPMTARAQGSAQVCLLGRQQLHECCRRYPDLALRLLAQLSQRVYQRVNEVDWVISSSAAQRLAVYMLNLAGPVGREINMPVNQRQLAARLGMRPETLNRLFSKWQEDGWISGRQRDWTLLDAEALQQVAGDSRRLF